MEMSSGFSEPICELEFTERLSGKKVTARLWRPVYDHEVGDWYCLSEVIGFDDGSQQRVYGYDPFQAMIISIERFRKMFSNHPGDFITNGEASSVVVFPKYIPWVYGLDVYDRLSVLVDKEIQVIEDERTRRREGEK